MKTHIWSRPDTSATSTAGDEHWGKDAPCTQPDVDPDLWHATKEEQTTARAVALCKRCPVIARCRKEVDDYELLRASTGIWGVWAGETADERTARRRAVA